MTSSQLAASGSSVGKALKRYRRGHGFQSGSRLNLFQAVYNCDDQSCMLSCTEEYCQLLLNMTKRTSLQFTIRAYVGSVYRMRSPAVFLLSHLCIFAPLVVLDPIRFVF